MLSRFAKMVSAATTPAKKSGSKLTKACVTPKNQFRHYSSHERPPGMVGAGQMRLFGTNFEGHIDSGALTVCTFASFRIGEKGIETSKVLAVHIGPEDTYETLVREFRSLIEAEKLTDQPVVLLSILGSDDCRDTYSIGVNFSEEVTTEPPDFKNVGGTAKKSTYGVSTVKYPMDRNCDPYIEKRKGVFEGWFSSSNKL